VYFALFYDVVDDYITRRQPLRTAHLTHAGKAQRDGLLRLGGAFNPPDGALLVFNADDVKQVEEWVQNDPYVLNGLVKAWRIREWTVVIGA